MILPNWAKIAWWAFLLIGVGAVLYQRVPAITSGTATPLDLVIFLLWIALFMAPVFKEVNLFGLKLSQHVAELQREVEDLRLEIRNSVDVRAQINPVFHFPTPPPDSQLPALEGRLRSVMTEVLRELGIERMQTQTNIPMVSDNVAFLFSARYHIEKELRRVMTARFESDDTKRPVPIFQITRTLAAEGILDPRLAHVVREVYAVTSPAVHGKPVTDAQVAFVRDVAPELISALRAIDSPRDA